MSWLLKPTHTMAPNLVGLCTRLCRGVYQRYVIHISFPKLCKEFSIVHLCKLVAQEQLFEYPLNVFRAGDRRMYMRGKVGFPTPSECSEIEMLSLNLLPRHTDPPTLLPLWTTHHRNYSHNPIARGSLVITQRILHICKLQSTGRAPADVDGLALSIR